MRLNKFNQNKSMLNHLKFIDIKIVTWSPAQWQIRIHSNMLATWGTINHHWSFIVGWWNVVIMDNQDWPGVKAEISTLA